MQSAGCATEQGLRYYNIELWSWGRGKSGYIWVKHRSIDPYIGPTYNNAYNTNILVINGDRVNNAQKQLYITHQDD